MRASNKTLIPPVVLITLGTGWLLTTIGVAPGVDWVWTLGLAIAGLLTLVIGGIDKLSIVIGPFLVLASCLSLLRQTGQLTMNIEIPILVILAGLLMFVARLPSIPAPKWMSERTDL
jgi:hypothetical protein